LENPNDGSARRWFDKKTSKKGLWDNLVAVTDQNQARASPPDGAGLFDKMLDEPCPYHKGLIKHTLRECDIMKRFFTSILAKGDAAKKPKDDKGGGFPVVNNYFMIFRGPVAYDTKRRRKLEHREVYAAEPTTPAYLN
jgi:hypothetical protein